MEEGGGEIWGGGGGEGGRETRGKSKTWSRRPLVRIKTRARKPPCRRCPNCGSIRTSPLKHVLGSLSSVYFLPYTDPQHWRGGWPCMR